MKILTLIAITVFLQEGTLLVWDGFSPVHMFYMYMGLGNMDLLKHMCPHSAKSVY